MKYYKLIEWILVLTLLYFLWSCRGDAKTGNLTGNENSEVNASIIMDSEGTSWLTHIYKSCDMELRDGWEIDGSAGIDYNMDTDEFRGLLLRPEEIEDENGIIKRVFEQQIIIWDGQGKLKAQYPLSDAEHRWRSFGQTCFFGDLLYTVLWEYTGQSFIGVWDIPSGELIAEKPTAEIQNWDPLNSVREVAVDGKGNLYISSGKQVTILSDVLVYLNVLKVRTVDMGCTPNGELWAICPDMAGYGLFRLDSEKGKEKLTYLDANASELAFIQSGSDTGWEVLSSTGTGICRFVPERSDGDRWLSEQLMNFANSRITYNFGVLGADGAYKTVAHLYTKAPDIDLASICTLLLAHEKTIPDNILTGISRFNRTHDDIRVITLDYSSYNNSENPFEELLVL